MTEPIKLIDVMLDLWINLLCAKNCIEKVKDIPVTCNNKEY